MIEKLLQFFVCKVDAELFKTVELKNNNKVTRPNRFVVKYIFNYFRQKQLELSIRIDKTAR